MKILLLIWTDPAWHPTFVSTAQIFAEAGHEVRILGRKAPPSFALPGPVDYGPGTKVSVRYQTKEGWRGRLDLLRFCRWAWGEVRRFRPDVVIGFDIYGVVAAFLASRKQRETRLIYHNFDLVPLEGLSSWTRVLKRIELMAARRAGMVLVSSPGRAQVLQEQTQLKKAPTVVMNCQRLCAPRKATGELGRLLEAQGLSFERLVVRMGLIGPGNAVEHTLRSVAHWQGNWGMIFAGVAMPGFLEEMRALVSELGLEKKVVFLPSVSYSLWYDCLLAADLGIALYVPENVNNQTMAGAGNKLNLYLSGGLPSILPDLPDFVSFAREFGAGEVAEATDPRAIAEAVNAVLSDPQKYAAYSQNAQRAFETQYNFETQYAPVLNWLNATKS